MSMGETPLKALTKVMKPTWHLLTAWVGSSVWLERAPVKRDVIGSNPILPAKNRLDGRSSSLISHLV